MATRATPAQPAERTVTTIREATPAAIDPSTYQPLGPRQERYYLAGVVEQRDVVDESREYLGIFATADGKRVTTPQVSSRDLPHALSIEIGVGPHADNRLETTGDELAALVARAHPEVPAP